MILPTPAQEELEVHILIAGFTINSSVTFQNTIHSFLWTDLFSWAVQLAAAYESLAALPLTSH